MSRARAGATRRAFRHSESSGIFPDILDYCRNQVSGGTFFFAVNLLDRRSDLSVTQIDVLRDAVRRVRARAPFRIDAWGRPSRSYALPVDFGLWTLPSRRCRLPRAVARNQNRICNTNRRKC